MYGIRSYYEPFRVNLNDNWERDAVTTSRTGVVNFGANAATLTDRMNIIQAGIDNTYSVRMSPSVVPATGGTATVVVRGAVNGSEFTYASGTSWISSASGTWKIFAPTSGTPPAYEGNRSFTVASQGTDKSKWYEPRTGSFLIERQVLRPESIGRRMPV